MLRINSITFYIRTYLYERKNNYKEQITMPKCTSVHCINATMAYIERRTSSGKIKKERVYCNL